MSGQPKKLSGYDFYRSIGSPKHIVAPMVDQSELVRLPKVCISGITWTRHPTRHGAGYHGDTELKYVPEQQLSHVEAYCALLAHLHSNDQR
jgi:hypothetical protein